MSFWQFTQVIESPPQSDFPSVPTYKYANAPEKVSSGNSLRPIVSIFQQLLHGRRDVAGLWQDHVLELRLICAESIHRGNAPDRGVQILKKFIGNARRDFRAISPAQRVFVSHDNPVGLSNGGRDGF